jgi:hypothetical protein
MSIKVVVIRISPEWPLSWFTQESDEDDGMPSEGPARTHDLSLAISFDTKALADAEVLVLKDQWPEHQFLVTEVNPLQCQ